MVGDLKTGQGVDALCSIKPLSPLEQVVERDPVKPPLLKKHPFPFR
jgi:hypothetical protein